MAATPALLSQKPTEQEEERAHPKATSKLKRLHREFCKVNIWQLPMTVSEVD